MIKSNACEADIIEFMRPAFLKTCLVGVKVTPNGVSAAGRPRYKYDLEFPKGSQKPVVNDAPEANPPF
jgi:hypothetical protein